MHDFCSEEEEEEVCGVGVAAALVGWEKRVKRRSKRIDVDGLGVMLVGLRVGSVLDGLPAISGGVGFRGGGRRGCEGGGFIAAMPTSSANTFT